MYNSQLDTFVRIAEVGSFSKAAELLYISPNAVIKQINLLEANLGLRLFDRTHRGMAGLFSQISRKLGLSWNGNTLRQEVWLWEGTVGR